jgi:conjugal transfer pilus assembly protein TraW
VAPALALSITALLMAVPVLATPDSSTAPAMTGVSDDLGKIGPTWPIAEHDLLDLMLAKARQKQADGEAGKLDDQLHARADAYIDHPPSLHLPRATTDSLRAFDPTLVLPYDIKDAKGAVLWPKGTRVNPLEHRSFDETLLFVDGDDAVQIDWLKRQFDQDHHHALHDKVVLTGGSPTRLAEQLKSTVPFYFDQDGKLTAKFGIDAVPASVAADPDAPRERLVIRSFDPLEGRS